MPGEQGCARRHWGRAANKKRTKGNMEKKQIAHRIIMPVQTKGSVGKTFECLARVAWYDEMGVDWRGYDGDSGQPTFFRSHPDKVFMLCQGRALESGDVTNVFRCVQEAPVTVVDPRAHTDEVMLEGMHSGRVFDMLDAVGGRLTVLLFPTEDGEVLRNIQAVVNAFGEKVDYMVVANPAVTGVVRLWEDSSPARDLAKLGARNITIPVLDSVARAALVYLDVDKERGRPLADLDNPKLNVDVGVQGAVNAFKEKLFAAYDECAEILLPETEYAKIKRGRRAPDWARARRATMTVAAPMGVRAAAG